METRATIRDRQDPRQVSIFGDDHEKELLKNMIRPSKELRDEIREHELCLEELRAELYQVEVSENEAANVTDPYTIFANRIDIDPDNPSRTIGMPEILGAPYVGIQMNAGELDGQSLLDMNNLAVGYHVPKT